MNPFLFYIEGQLARLRFDLIQDYALSGNPFGLSEKGFAIWVEYCEATTVN
jgi:hypothetical protein